VTENLLKEDEKNLYEVKNQPFYHAIGWRRRCRDARFVRPLKVNSSTNTRLLKWTHEPCVPTYIQSDRGIGHIDNQRLTPCASISPILPCNMGHITVQYGWKYRAIRLILQRHLTAIKNGRHGIIRCAW